MSSDTSASPDDIQAWFLLTFLLSDAHFLYPVVSRITRNKAILVKERTCGEEALH
jgi:hypothetical protein